MKIWEKTTVDEKGKCVIPKIIRDLYEIRKGDKILWIGFNKKKENELIVNICIIKRD